MLTNVQTTFSPGAMSIDITDEPSEQVADCSIQASGTTSLTAYPLPGYTSKPTELPIWLPLSFSEKPTWPGGVGPLKLKKKLWKSSGCASLTIVREPAVERRLANVQMTTSVALTSMFDGLDPSEHVAWGASYPAGAGASCATE